MWLLKVIKFPSNNLLIFLPSGSFAQVSLLTFQTAKDFFVVFGGPLKQYGNPVQKGSPLQTRQTFQVFEVIFKYFSHKYVNVHLWKFAHKDEFTLYQKPTLILFMVRLLSDIPWQITHGFPGLNPSCLCLLPLKIATKEALLVAGLECWSPLFCILSSSLYSRSLCQQVNCNTMYM